MDEKLAVAEIDELPEEALDETRTEELLGTALEKLTADELATDEEAAVAELARAEDAADELAIDEDAADELATEDDAADELATTDDVADGLTTDELAGVVLELMEVTLELAAEEDTAEDDAAEEEATEELTTDEVGAE